MAVDVHDGSLLPFRGLSSAWGTRVIANRFRLCLVAGALVVGALVVGACAGDDDASDVTVAPDETSVPESTTTEATTTTTEDPTVAVEQAFYDQWDAFVEILEDPDPSNPLIEQHFSGDAKDAVLDGVSSLIADGLAIRTPDNEANFEPRIVEVRILSPTSAAVFECTLEGLVIYHQESGDVVEDAVSEFESRNDFEMIDGRYVVTSTRDIEEGEPGCDEL